MTPQERTISLRLGCVACIQKSPSKSRVYLQGTPLVFGPYLRSPFRKKLAASQIHLHDKTFVPYLDETAVLRAVDNIASQMNTDFEGKTPLVVVVLNGAFVFGADLLKRLTFNCEVAFIRVSSYRGTASTGEVKEQMPLGADVSGRDVIVIEDIVDSGLTMENLRLRMTEAGADSVSLCTLLFKPDAFQGMFELRYVGIEIPDRFVVGYGLDYDGLGRNIPSIYQLKV